MKNAIRNACAAALGILIALCVLLLILINFTPQKGGFADEAAGEVIAAEAAKDKFADEVYLSSASVCLNEFKVRANGGGEVNNAFDKNLSSVWRSASANNQGFTNTLTLNFDSAVTADCIVYGGVFEEVEGEMVSYGFPKLLKVYASSDGTEPTLAATFAGDATSELTMLAFASPLTFKTLVLEFTEVTKSTGGEVAAAAEIYIVKTLSGDAEKVTKEVNSLFEDYSRFKLKPDYDSKKLTELRTRAEVCANYTSALKPVLDRAEGVLAGLIKKNTAREFSTEKDAENKILLYGGAKEYSRDTLLTNSFGTDRQVLGIGGAYGEKFTVYVQAEEGLPLPSLAFTYENGEGFEEYAIRPLARGVNTVTYPLPETAQPNSSGGPIYLISPAAAVETKAKNSGVQIYLEGGYTYPVFRDGGNEKTFLKLLEDYAARLNDPHDLSITSDICELAASNVIITAKATFALDYYTHGDISPQENISGWNKYIRSLLEFDGITFDKKAEEYDGRNEYLAVNFRFAPAYAGVKLYEREDFIAVCDEEYLTQLLGFDTPDTELTLALGRALEKRGREWQGFTDEFFAIYGNWLLNGEYAADIADAASKLASDLGEYAINKNLWLNGNDGAWWALQGANSDYWAKLERLYCFEQTGKTLDPTEKFVYYSSIALGADASAYFERWGYYHGDSVYNANNRFSYDRASANFKQLFAAAKSEGRIGGAKKFHYIDDKQFTYLFENMDKPDGGFKGAYSSNQTATVKEIIRTADGYTLFMPDPAKPDEHLCYEVQGYIEGEWKVLGITYGTAFCDGYKYADGGRPRYRVYAYDRLLNCTGTPSDASPDGKFQSETCRVGSVRYNSLREAVAAAPSGGTVYLLKSFSDSGVVINKSLTVLADPSVSASEGVTVTASGAGPLITVSANLTFGGTGGKIILDGKGVYRTGALVEVTSQNQVICTFTNVTFKNSFNYGDGGGLYLGAGARQVNLYNCTVENNRAENGGGIFVAGGLDGGYQTRLNLCGVSITGNTANKNGGGIFVAGGNTGVYDISSDGVKPYTVIGLNKAENGGGIYSYATVNLNGAAVAGNTAVKNGGGAYVAGGNIGRRFELTDCTLTDNIAGEAICTALYFAGGYSTLNCGKIKGGIFKNKSAMVNINAAMPDFTEAEFYLDEITEEGVILINTVTGFTATEQIVSSLKVANGNAELYGATVVVTHKVAAIVLNFEDGSITVNADCGKYILPERFEGLAEGYYISKWSTEEKDYFPGDTVEIIFDCEFKVELTRYFTVTLVYGVKTKVISVIQYGEFCLPTEAPDGGEVYGWNCSDGKYYSCGGVKDIEYDTVFTADLKRLHSVTLSVSGVEATTYYGYGSSVTLAAPAQVFGETFSHWWANGVSYPAGSTLTLTQDIKAVAVYSSQWAITTVTDGSEEVATYADGEVITLQNPSGSTGGEFLYWLTGGVKYFAGSRYKVNGNAVITAIYGPAPEKVTATYIVNGVVTYAEFAFGASVTLAAPELENFNCWLINGVNYPANGVITATQSFTAVAVTGEIGEVIVGVLDYADGEEVINRYTYPYGSVLCLPLPTGMQFGKAFSHWVVNGERLEAGELITVTENTVIVAVYDKGYTVKLVQLVEGKEKTDTYELGYTRKFILPAPASAPQGKAFTHWAVGQLSFNAGDEITVMLAVEIRAVYKDLATFTVTVTDTDKDDITVEVAEGEVFILPDPDDRLWGDKFHYWDVNGVRYAAGAQLTVLENSVIKAVYSAQYKVTVIQLVDGTEKETTYTVSHGDSFKLPTPAEAPSDRKFDHWKINGVEYAAGDRISVTQDLVISAVYVNSEGEQIVTKSNKTKWIIIGVASGVAVVAAGAWAAVYFIKRKKKAQADKK